MEAQEQVGCAASRPSDRRAFPRCAVDEEAGLLLVEHGLRLVCRVLDLSMEGCRIRTAQRLPIGIHVRVEVTFTINGIPFRMAGLIQRSNSEYEVGIRFVDVTPRRKAEWAEVVGEMQEALAIKARKEAARAEEEAVRAKEKAAEAEKEKERVEEESAAEAEKKLPHRRWRGADAQKCGR